MICKFWQITIYSLLLLTTGCANKNVNAVVDTLYISDQKQYEVDRQHCQKVALTYDLSDEKAMKGLYGAAVGGSVATGAAMALAAGAVNPVAIPVIVGASLLGAAGGAMSTEERQARENIMYQCLAMHGYTAYSPHSNNLVTQQSNPKSQGPSLTSNLETVKTKCLALGFKVGSKEYVNCIKTISE
jgi:hypothetical protein